MAGAGTSGDTQTLAQFRQAKREFARREREGEFDHTRCQSQDAERTFGRLWSTLKVVPERRLMVAQFDEEPYRWLRVFTQRQWLGLAGYRGQYSATLVAEFMANITSLHADQGNRFIIRSWVRGVEIEITPN